MANPAMFARQLSYGESAMDEISLYRLQEICPTLQDKALQLDQLLTSQGITIRITQALRSWDAQRILYQQGRNKPGEIVTYADAGYSWHEFGLAFDVVPLIEAGRPDWNKSHPVWGKIVAAGESVGLVSGAHWSHPRGGDTPHFQMTGRFPVTPTHEAREIYYSIGLKGIWVESGIWTPPPPSAKIST